MNKQLEAEGVKLSLNRLRLQAVAGHCSATRRSTPISRRLDRPLRDVHLGIARRDPDGLIVPVIRSADQMGLAELQQRTAELAKKSRRTRRG